MCSQDDFYALINWNNCPINAESYEVLNFLHVQNILYKVGSVVQSNQFAVLIEKVGETAR